MSISILNPLGADMQNNGTNGISILGPDGALMPNNGTNGISILDQTGAKKSYEAGNTYSILTPLGALKPYEAGNTYSILAPDGSLAVYNTMGIFNVTKLFENGEKGVWYDPSDFSTLFQDTRGGIPVTAVEQPVALMLDKRNGSSLGPELVINSTFSNGTTGWTPDANAELTNIANELRVRPKVDATGTPAYVFHNPGMTPGHTYVLSYDLRVEGTGAVGVRIGIGGVATFPDNHSASSTVTRRLVFVASGGVNDLQMIVYGTVSTIAVFDNVSLKRIGIGPGNHASQPTNASRPVLTSPTYIKYDGVDDALVITFPSSLGSSCTVGRAVPGVGASIATAQTIGTTYTDTTNHAGLVIIDRALTGPETTSLTTYLNNKAGV